MLWKTCVLTALENKILCARQSNGVATVSLTTWPLTSE